MLRFNKRLRRHEILQEGPVQRCWEVTVRDADAMMHDPGLFRLAKEIERGLGRRARFMLRQGEGSQIRILVEAQTAEKGLLAMLRFVRAAERKKYLTGPVEEVEL